MPGSLNDNRRVVVVGSGPAGATAALALLERGIPVTLLESGTQAPAGLIVRALGRNLYRSWARPAEAYEYVASADPTTRALTALTPGGLSNYWTGAVPRFAPPDFYEGARLHERYRWPLSYTDLEPYYTYAERLLQVVGERRTVAQVSTTVALTSERQLPGHWKRLAATANSHGQGLMYAPIADGPRWMIRRSGAAFNSFQRLSRRLHQFENFELRLGAHAQRLIWNASANRVDAVEYRDRSSGVAQQVSASAVVVAAGPLASAKLLLQSQSRDFPDGLGNSRGLLGRYLHDHPHDWCVLELDTPLPRLDQPVHITRSPYEDSEPLRAAQLTLGPLSKWDRIASLGHLTTRQFGVVTFGTMLPSAHNRVALAPSGRDRFGMPLLDVHIDYSTEDTATIADSHERLLAIFERAGIKARLACPVDRFVPGSSAHYAGAVRMHAAPEYGVLDGWNRLHDTDSVAVVDASCFTTCVEKNPTLTVMALAARAADRLADDLRNDSLQQGTQVHALSSVR